MQLPVRDRSATVGHSLWSIATDGPKHAAPVPSCMVGTADFMHHSVHLRARLIAASSDFIGRSISAHHGPIYFIILGFRLRVS
jgi:hypothetical protein